AELSINKTEELQKRSRGVGAGPRAIQQLERLLGLFVLQKPPRNLQHERFILWILERGLVILLERFLRLLSHLIHHAGGVMCVSFCPLLKVGVTGRRAKEARNAVVLLGP